MLKENIIDLEDRQSRSKICTPEVPEKLKQYKRT